MKRTRPILALLLIEMLTLATRAEISIPFEIVRDSRVSLGIYSQDGQLVCTLLTGKPLAKGEHAATWDGRDRYGNALPVGDYTWKLVATTGLRSEFITQIGQNPDPIWEKSVANHEPPMAAAVDATGVYRIGAFDEGAHAGVKTDLNGRYLWTTDRDKVDPWCHFGAALTLVDGQLFELIHNGTIYRYDAQSGNCLTKGNGDGLWNFRWDGGPAKSEGKEAERLRGYVERTGMDLTGNSAAKVLVASYRAHDAVRWFDPATGRQLAEVSVPESIGVAVQNDGSALVISNGAVVEVSREGGGPRVVIPAEQLRDPWRLCISPASGDIFVAENSVLARGKEQRDASAPHHQVKRFSSAGQLIATLGAPGGRQDGPYVPTDFCGITDIEADHEGGFVVTEGHHQPPRRSVRFDENGKLLREWLGAAEYGVLACPEPENPDYVWIHANGERGGMIRCKVDYANKSWSIIEIYRDSLARNPLWKSGHQLFRIFARDGRLHFFGISGMSPFVASIYDPKTKTMRVTNASGDKGKGGDFWNDLNDDGMPQSDEMMRVGQQVGGSVAGPEFSLFTAPQPSGFNAGPKLAVERFTPGGTPVYGYNKQITWPAWKENGAAYRGWDIVAAPDGGWFGCFSDSLKSEQSNNENHGAWYMNSCAGIDRIVKWDRDWKQLWSAGRHSPDFDHEAGSTAMGRGLVGTTHGCVILAESSDEEFARCSVWTDDGLFVDELLRVPVDTMRKELHGLNNGLEFPISHVITEPATGDLLFFAVNTAGGSPIYRITGWKDWHRQSGSIKLVSASTDVAKRDGIGLKAEYFNNLDCTGKPVLTRTEKAIYFHWLKDRDKLPEGVNPEGFSVRWSGQVEALTMANHRFTLETMTPWVGQGWGTDGKPAWMKLSVGGQTIIDTANDRVGVTTNGICGDVLLEAGRRYDLVLECGYRGNAVAKLCWETPELERRAIVPEFLHSEIGSKTKADLAIIQRPELLAHFTFDKSDGNLDWSLAGGDVFGRLTGNTRRVSGKIGQGIEFSPKGQFDPALYPIDEESRLPDGDYTVAFWFKTMAKDTRLCETKHYSSYNNRWSDHVVAIENGKLSFRLQGDEPIETSATFNDGQWHHAVTTVGPGGQRLHVDGQLIGTGKLSKRTKTSNRLGLDLGPGGGEGVVVMDELRILSRALSASDVERLFRQTDVTAKK